MILEVNFWCYRGKQLQKPKSPNFWALGRSWLYFKKRLVRKEYNVDSVSQRTNEEIPNDNDHGSEEVNTIWHTTVMQVNMPLNEPLEKQVNIESVIHQYGITIKMMGFSIRSQRFWLKTHYISKEASNKQVYISSRLKNQIYILGRTNIKPFGT